MDPLRSRDESSNESKAPLVRIVLREDVRLERGKEYFVCGEVDKSSEVAGSMLFSPNVFNLSKRSVIAANAVISVSNGSCPVRVYNVSNEAVNLYRGTHLGDLEDYHSVKSVCKLNESPNSLPINTEKFLRQFNDQLSKIPPSERKEITDIFIEFSDVFSRSKFDIGLAKDVEHVIETGNALPIHSNPRRVPLGVEKKVDELVEQLLEHKIIRPSRSAWNSPIVVVAKKNGDIRMCVDYRKLNSVTTRQIFPIPDAHQLFDTLNGSAYFSTLDLSQGYHQVRVAEKDIPKTAFATRKGQYEYLRMPFGLCSAPATFQMLMNSVLHSENWQKCLIYLDDILVFGRTKKEHHERLRSVLQRIREAGLKLSPEKCRLFQTEVTYLGHTISLEGVRTSPEKIEKVQNFKSPCDPMQLRTFLGLCGYYRRYIKDYAQLVAPLEKLCLSCWNKKITKSNSYLWKWEEEHEKAFQHLKWCLTNAPILGFPSPNGHYILDTDASHDCVGAVLSQIQNGKEVVIAYASNKLTKSERAYCITRKELFAIYKYVIQFKHYLYGRKFTVRTDHQALTWLLNWKHPNTSQYCTWRAELELYDMEIIYRPGHLHANADALSRLPQCEQCDIKHDDPQRKRNSKRLEVDIRESEHVVCKLSNLHTKWDQFNDPEIGMILKLLKAGRLEDNHPLELEGQPEATRCLWNKRKQLRIRGDLLYLQLDGSTYVLIVPRSKRIHLIRLTHQTLGHIGITRTSAVLKQQYFWPGMDTDIRLIVNTCRPCLEKKSGNMGLQPKPQSSMTGFPFEKVAIDITGPLPPGHNGHRYLLGIVDYYSKFPVLVSIQNTDAKTVAEALVKHWIAIFGSPHSIHSDRGSCFQAELFQELCKFFQINKTKTAPYHPQADGVIERLFRTVKDMMYSTVRTYKRDWVTLLPIVEMGLRSTINCSTKLSPYQVLFGRQMRVPIEWADCGEKFEMKPLKEYTSPSHFVMELRKQLEEMYEKIERSKNGVSPQSVEKRYAKPLTVGDFVMAKVLPEKRGMLIGRYYGPFEVVRLLGKYTYRLKHCRTGEIIDRNHRHIKPCQNLNETQYIQPQLAAQTGNLSGSPPRMTRSIVPPERYGFSRRGEVS